MTWGTQKTSPTKTFEEAAKAAKADLGRSQTERVRYFKKEFEKKK